MFFINLDSWKGIFPVLCRKCPLLSTPLIKVWFLLSRPVFFRDLIPVMDVHKVETTSSVGVMLLDLRSFLSSYNFSNSFSVFHSVVVLADQDLLACFKGFK